MSRFCITVRSSSKPPSAAISAVSAQAKQISVENAAPDGGFSTPEGTGSSAKAKYSSLIGSLGITERISRLIFTKGYDRLPRLPQY
jgi:hypothetical protein